MEYTILIILLALVQYVIFTVRVAANRGQYKIHAPATSGDETWERLFRVQQNTMEQLVIFIPAAVIFGLYVKGAWILIPGLMFILGRFLYAQEYVNNPATRTPGMALTLLANAVLLGGGLIGVALKFF
jgi:uncharacterized membrane protein YecN with MAPEG domain